MGDMEKLIEEHKGLVKKLTLDFYLNYKTRFDKLQIEYEDVLQLGYEGLLRANKLFDKDRGEAKFSTYATITIQGHLRRKLLRDYNIIKLPRDFDSKGYKEHKEELKQLWSGNLVDYLSTPVVGEGGKELLLEEVITDNQDRFSALELRLTLNKILNDRELKILSLHIQKMKQEDIGKEFGISQMQISRIIKRIKSKVREAI